MRVLSWRSLALLAVLSTAACTISAQCVSLTTLGSAATQNFDTLSNTAGSTTNNLTITGWFMTETGGGARDNEQYGVDTGGSTTGDTYSYGAAGSTERALGGLRSGTLIPNFGACYTNNTGATIGNLAIAYNGEEWRLGTAARTDQINFEYSTNATDLTTGTWTNVTALNFVTPDTATTGAKNGNAAADRTALSSTISSLSIANGATFWIRWTDVDASSADDGLAVDDFSLTPTAAVVPPNLTVNDVSLNEGNAGTTSFTFTVSLSAPAGPGGVTFDIATADNTANQPADYTQKSLTSQTIPAGSSTYAFTVLVNGDTTPETNETFFVNVTNAVGATVLDGQGQGTIVNDDVAPNLTINDVSLGEGNSGTTSFIFTVSLSAPAGAGGVTFDIGTANDSATQPGDYNLNSLTGQTIPAGSSTYTFTVLVNGDLVAEGNESFFVNVSNVTNAILTDGQGVGTIVNDDFEATISVAPASTFENAGPLTYTVILNPAPVFNTQVNFSVAGTATSGSDYNAIGSTSVTVLAGQTSATLPVSLIDDALSNEGNETLILSLLSGVGYNVVVGNDVATGTIADDDVSRISISVSPFQSLEDSATNLTYSFTNTAPSVTPITVGLVFTGTADNGIDYTASGTSVTFAAGSTTPQTITVDPTVDAVVELDETVIVTVQPGAGYTPNLGSDVATGTILNDDLPQATITAATSSVAEDSGSPLIYQIALSQAPASNTIVQFNVTGTAFGGIDYPTVAPTSVTFLVGETTKTVSIVPTSDPGLEADETVVLNLVLSSGYTLGVNDSATGTIVNDDTTNANIGALSNLVNEDSGTALSFQITLTQAPVAATTVNFLVGGTASAGSDYSSIAPLSVTFPIGSTSQTVTVTPTVDTTLEADETVVLTLQSGSGYALGANTSATGTIANDDSTLANIVASTSSTAENSGSALSFDITLSQAPVTATTVDFSVSGTAIPGTDYPNIAPFSVTFPIGATTQTVSVIPTGDATVEPDETIVLTLQNGVGYLLGANTVATATILNDDSITANISATTASSPEDSGTALVYSITLSQAPLVATTVDFGVSGTATAGSDYPAISPLSVTFPIGATAQTVLVTPSSDTTLEADETIVLNLQAGVGYTLGGSTVATGTIVNDDASLANIVATTASVTENSGSALSFDVTLSQAPIAATTVSFTVTGTATAGTDYPTIAPQSVTFPIGVSTQTVNVTPTGDTSVEADETIVLTLQSGSGYALGANTVATGSIVNDDSLDANITASTATVAENSGNALSFDIALSQAPVVATTVTFAVSGSASAGTDYPTIAPQSVTFPIGVSTQTVTVTPIGDTTLEADETVILTLQAGSGYNLGANTTATGTISNDDFSADLSFTVTDSPDPVSPGAPVTYAITISNAGPSPADSPSFSFPLPAGLTFVSLSAPGGWTCTPPAVGSNGTVTCSATALAAGQSAAFSLVAQIPAGAAIGTIYAGTVSLTSNTPDPNPGNNSATTVSTTVQTAGGPVTPVPSLDLFGRLMLMLLVLGVAGLASRQRL